MVSSGPSQSYFHFHSHYHSYFENIDIVFYTCSFSADKLAHTAMYPPIIAYFKEKLTVTPTQTIAYSMYGNPQGSSYLFISPVVLTPCQVMKADIILHFFL